MTTAQGAAPIEASVTDAREDFARLVRDADTLPADVELSAAQQDLESTGRLLVHAANALKDTAHIPHTAAVGYAQALLFNRTDLIARVRFRQYIEAATAYEGARVALATLTNQETS